MVSPEERGPGCPEEGREEARAGHGRPLPPRPGTYARHRRRPGGLRAAKGRGVRFLADPYRYPWGIGALLLDEDGSPILLQQESEER